MSSAEQLGQRRKEGIPQLNVDIARALVLDKFGIDAVLVKELASYDDRNFYVKTADKEFTLKVHNTVEQDAILDCQNNMMTHLLSKGILCPQPTPSKEGKLLEHATLALKNGTEGVHGMRLLSWVPGRMMHDLTRLTDSLLLSSGSYLGDLTAALSDFSNPACEREHEWDLRNTSAVAQHIPLLLQQSPPNIFRARLVANVIEEFERDVLPLFIKPPSGLRRGVLMGDFNDANVIVSGSDGDYCDCVSCWEYSPCVFHGEVKVVGLIDFGDIVRSFSVCELGIAVMYIMVNIAGQVAATNGDRSAIVAKAAIFYAGYCSRYTLSAVERRLLIPLVLCRLAMSCLYGFYSQSKDPTNLYLKMHSEPAWLALEVLSATPREEVEAIFEKADSRRRRDLERKEQSTQD